MRQIKIFMASSGTSLDLAKKLASAIETKSLSDRKLNVIKWWEDGAFHPGESTLGALLQQSAQCDFAVVLLTRDDWTTKKNFTAPFPRDNCIYEAGLFTGALGCNPKRCFLVTSVEEKALPTDLSGITTIRIRQPKYKWFRRGSENEECDKKIQEAADTIIENVDQIGIYHRAILTSEELMDIERDKSENGNLVSGSSVVISARQPIELNNPKFAERVLKNMEAAIYYDYFFQVDHYSVRMFAQLVQVLAACPMADDHIYLRKNNMEWARCITTVKKNLKTLRRHLTIRFLTEESRDPLCVHSAVDPLCVHNAERDTNAKCYLRHPLHKEAKFVLWCEGREATKLASKLRDRRFPEKGFDPECIFASTAEFNLKDPKNEKFTQQLMKELLWLFPEEVKEDVKSCIECLPKAA